MIDIYAFLKTHDISYESFAHPAVFTCEEAERLCPTMPGVPVKNLFLRSKDKKRHLLVVVGYDKRVDLNELKTVLGISGLGFASSERLKKYLGVEPGSVTLLGLVNDIEHAVEVIFDQGIWGQALQCHPLVNTATLVIPANGIEQFLKATGHAYQVMEVPGTTVTASTESFITPRSFGISQSVIPIMIKIRRPRCCNVALSRYSCCFT
ncbi:MAG: prolyl-tRNA synthetase associated domain-containing protein [Candidatus Gracilibacteria bacterium]